MANLSIRNIPPDLEEEIVKQAKKQHVTKTQVVLTALRQIFNLIDSEQIIRRDIRSFFGKMSLKEYKEFKKRTKEFSKIDTDMWT